MDVGVDEPREQREAVQAQRGPGRRRALLDHGGDSRALDHDGLVPAGLGAAPLDQRPPPPHQSLPPPFSQPPPPAPGPPPPPPPPAPPAGAGRAPAAPRTCAS